MFSQSRIVMGNNSLKEPRAPIATSRGFPAELGNIQALPENPEKLQLPRVHNKVKILVYDKFTELISTSSFLI